MLAFFFVTYVRKLAVQPVRSVIRDDVDDLRQAVNRLGVALPDVDTGSSPRPPRTFRVPWFPALEARLSDETAGPLPRAHRTKQSRMSS